MKYYGIAIGGENAGKYFECDRPFFYALKKSKLAKLEPAPTVSVEKDIENNVEEYKHFTLHHMGDKKTDLHFWVPTTVGGDPGEYVLRELVTCYRANNKEKRNENCL